MNLPRITIRNSERVAIFGASGSGKTEIAKFLLRHLNRVVVIDPKHEFKLEGFERLKKNWRVPMFSKNFRLIVRPRIGQDEQLFDFIEKLYMKKNVTIFVDEMAVLNEFFPETTGLLRVIQVTGREKRVALWTATQRPRGTPRAFLTESENFFLFRLRAEEDREYMAGFLGDEIVERVPMYKFWYIRSDEEFANLFTLNLDDMRIETASLEERSPNA